MKNYKAPDNSVHCIDPDFYALLPAGCVEITQAEAEAIREASKPVVDPKVQTLALISQIERETLMNRATRELMLGIAEKEGASLGLTPEQLYVANVAYRSVKDVDSRIAALRAQIGEL